MALCPNCGNQAGEGAIFCDRCGARLPEPKPVAPASQPAKAAAGGSIICPACGAGNVPGEAFCDFCGSPLAAPVPDSLPPAAGSSSLPPAAGPSSLPPAAAGGTQGGATSDPAPTPPAAEAQPACPACGVTVLAGEAFCADCGASLAQ
jgi:predicted amidophosphoribosyltransferase